MTLETDPRGQYAGRRVRALRKEFGLSQQALLDRLRADPEAGITWSSFRTILNIEKGKRRFPFDKARAIARAFDVPLSDVIGHDTDFPNG